MIYIMGHENVLNSRNDPEFGCIVREYEGGKTGGSEGR